MKKLIYLPVCLGMLFFSAACENWFDVSPKSDVKAEDLFQQESGFRDVLTGVYSLMSAPESYDVSFHSAMWMCWRSIIIFPGIPTGISRRKIIFTGSLMIRRSYLRFGAGNTRALPI